MCAYDTSDAAKIGAAKMAWNAIANYSLRLYVLVGLAMNVFWD